MTLFKLMGTDSHLHSQEDHARPSNITLFNEFYRCAGFRLFNYLLSLSFFSFFSFPKNKALIPRTWCNIVPNGGTGRGTKTAVNK